MITTEHSEVDERNSGWLEAVQNRVAALRFGAVEIVVHDGRVVQIQTTEKIRIERVEN